MIAEAAATAIGALGLRALAHRVILRALRAPRLPHPPGAGDAHVPPGAVHEVRIKGPRGRGLFGWLVMPAPGSAHPAPAMLVMHGWGANAGMMWPVVPPLHAAGFAVLLIDARCHGRSDEEAFSSMPSFAQDIAVGLAWLRSQAGIDADRLALLGHSVGAGAALLHAARHRDVRAVVSLSAFANPSEMMRRFLREKGVPYPVLGWYVMRHVQGLIGTTFDAIAPLSTLPRVRCPVLLVHGRDDKTVPFADARRLQGALLGTELLAVDGDHDLRDALAPHAGDIVDFLRGALGEPCNPQGDAALAPMPTLRSAAEGY